MTPGARVQTAIELLDLVLAGEPAEKVLTQWARKSRFAGSKDRVAVRDYVYDVLRRRKSCAAHGGPDGRGLMLGLLRLEGADLGVLFSGGGYGPAPLSDDEMIVPEAGDVVDLPDWLIPEFQAALGDDYARTARALCDRAPVVVRVNPREGTVDEAVAALAGEAITAVPCDICDTALVLGEGARKLSHSGAYQNGLVELQDGSSQAAVARIEVAPGARVLDMCAGGGGKTLALAGRVEAIFHAHDIDPKRMRDLSKRARRAGTPVVLVEPEELDETAPYDVILCDVPCSGSGTWRRAPDAKWRFGQGDLAELVEAQDGILDRAVELSGSDGRIAYMTCSVLRAENEDRVAAFLARHAGWKSVDERRWPLSDQGDGFYIAQLMRE